MIHIMNEHHEYHSPLRQEQMKRTREQILEGFIRIMARGVTELSIPAVAREAGVSVPTIYRYFRSKRDLVEALGGYFVEKAGRPDLRLPRSLEELTAQVRELFVKYENIDEIVRAAAMSGVSFELRKEVLQARLKIIEDALAPVLSQLNEADRIRLRNIVFLLSTTATIRAFKDYLGLTGEEAADNVVWAILTLTRGATRVNETES
jgi:AcrR family transcriptional regulator